MTPSQAQSIRELAAVRGFNKQHESYTRIVERRKNYFRKFQGYGFDFDLLENIFKNGAKIIIIHESDTGDILLSTQDQWYRCAEQHHDPQYGEQIVLPEWYMGKLSKNDFPRI